MAMAGLESSCPSLRHNGKTRRRRKYVPRICRVHLKFSRSNPYCTTHSPVAHKPYTSHAQGRRVILQYSTGFSVTWKKPRKNPATPVADAGFRTL